MPGRALTLMAVHAHPDDEATSTGGILARYADEGVRTVVVTCTDGACGDGEGGAKPGEAGHDPRQVVALRAVELEASCAILGVTHLERLDFPDSGMAGWPQNHAPGSFWTTPVDEAAGRLAALMERYRPQVVVTYDPNGFYGHPDHIQAHRITMTASASTGIPAKVYWPTIPVSAMVGFAQRLRSLGVELPEGAPGGPGGSGEGGPGGSGEGGPGGGGGIRGTPDQEVAAWIDVAAQVERKHDALAAHASQGASNFLLRLGREGFAELMGREAYVRALDRTGSPTPEDDLFAGLR